MQKSKWLLAAIVCVAVRAGSANAATSTSSSSTGSTGSSSDLTLPAAIANFPLPAELKLPCAEASPTPTATPSSSASASSTSGTSGYLRKCSEVLNGASGQKGLLALFDEQVASVQENGIYSKKRDYPVCNPVPNTFNKNRAELDNNHLNENCGNPSTFVVNVSSSGANTEMTFHAPYMERAYFEGALSQSGACYWQQVRREITEHRAIRVVAPECQAAARTLAYELNQKLDAAKGIERQIGGMKNIQDIWKCETQSASINDLGSLKVSALELCSARANLESAFTQYAVCEVQHRAARGHRRMASTPDELIEVIRSGAVQNCKQQCISSCSSCVSPIRGATSRCSSCATSCANQCYPGELRRFYYQRIEQNWPNDGSCKL